MGLYVVSYDLRGVHRPAEDYARIFEYLKSSGTWCRPLDSFWLVKTTDTPQQVIDKAYAAGVVAENDGLVVLELTGKGAWRRVDDGRPYYDAADWLTDYITRE
jgi:hypothetical protein